MSAYVAVKSKRNPNSAFIRAMYVHCWEEYENKGDYGSN